MSSVPSLWELVGTVSGRAGVGEGAGSVYKALISSSDGRWLRMKLDAASGNGLRGRRHK